MSLASLDARPSPPIPQQLIVNLDAYEGPLEVLLDLAKSQKVDLSAISILTLVEQYLAFVQAVKRQNLEVAADYLVMAAVLAYLKSLLLLPPPDLEVPDQDPAALAAALAQRLERLNAMKDAGEALMALPMLGQDRFATDRLPEARVTTRVRYTAGLYDLLSAYAGVQHRQATSSLTVEAPQVYKFEDALARLSSLLQVATPTWTRLQDMLPEGLATVARPLRRSVVAATLLAGLELTRQGKVELRQDRAFGPVLLRALDPATMRG